MSFLRSSAWRQRLPAVARVLLVVAVVFTTYMALSPRAGRMVASLNDKVLHALAFLTLSLLTDHAFPSRRFNWVPMTLILSYGAAIEVVQRFVPARTSSWKDLVADVIGIALYWLMAPRIRDLSGLAPAPSAPPPEG